MKKINIILEGCDCTGKSAISEVLHKYFGYPIVHTKAPKDKEGGEKYVRNMVDTLNTTSGVIYDRAILSECVYSPIYRDYYPEYMRDIEKEIGNGTYLFLITATSAKVKERFDGKFIKKKDIEMILNNFNTEFVASNYKNKYIIDTSDITVSEAAIDIITTIVEGVFYGNKEV